MNDPHFTTYIAQCIWETKYRYRERGIALDACIEDTWQRIAQALAAQETDKDH